MIDAGSALLNDLIDELDLLLRQHLPAPSYFQTTTYRFRSDERILYSCCRDSDFACEVDPSIRSPVDLVHKKGLLVLLAYRIAHRLIADNAADAAFTLHALCAKYLAVDIDPRCTIEPGVYLDHATGTVIGETAYIGPRVLLYHGVTLGSLRPEPRGTNRHPYIEGETIIGCGATLLGAIKVYRGARIRAGSLVTTDVHPTSLLYSQHD